MSKVKRTVTVELRLDVEASNSQAWNAAMDEICQGNIFTLDVGSVGAFGTGKHKVNGGNSIRFNSVARQVIFRRRYKIGRPKR